MFTVTVTEAVDATDAVKALRLARSDGSPLPDYPAGAHIDVTGPTGITRPYSLCGPPQDPSATIHIGFRAGHPDREQSRQCPYWASRRTDTRHVDPVANSGRLTPVRPECDALLVVQGPAAGTR